MKNASVILTLALLFSSAIAFGQDVEAPKKGAKIHIEESTIDLQSGTEQTFDVWIVRSKKAQRATFYTPKFVSSTDLAFDVTADPENEDHYIVTAKSSSAAAGKYMVTVKSRSNGTQFISGTTLSVNVAGGKAVAAQNE
jgi:hypothetical protein